MILRNKTLFLTIFFFAITLITIEAQNGWNSGYFYANKGGSDIICGSTFILNKSNGRNHWQEGWQNCRQRVWYQELHSGYIYLWGRRGWYKEWKEGFYWSFRWRDFSKRVW